MFEIGESLGESWLRHVQNCTIVQCNWKASPQIPWLHLEEIDVLLNELRLEFGEDSVDIWGEINAVQLVRQTECDVLGYRILNGEQSVIALEVATHLTGDGLGYSGIKHTNPTRRVNISDDKVPAKLFSNAMALYATAGICRGEIVFASPIANEILVQRINDRLGRVERILNNRGFGFRLRLYANRDFYMEILRPVVAVVNDVSNTNEAFLRAMQLYTASSRRWAPIGNEEWGREDLIRQDANDGQPGIAARHHRIKYDVIVNHEVYQAQLSMGDAAYYSVVAYCENTAGSVFQDISTAFPRAVHGTREVVEVEREGLDLIRYSPPIILNDGTRVLVTNQWCGAGPRENWHRFEDNLANLDRPGLEIRIVPHR